MLHRVRAVNTAPDSENKIHDDRVAAEYGFRGGLVPGVAVYGYMMDLVLASAPHWRESGTMELRLLEPFFDGDEVLVRVEGAGELQITAEREDGTICAKGVAWISPLPAQKPALLEDAALPAPDQRPIPSRETVLPGSMLGSFQAVLDAPTPEVLLQLSNDILERNFRLGPWIHVGSDLRNWSAARPGEQVSIRGRVEDRFDRKGHEFVVAGVMVIGDNGRLIQTVRHTAIYRLRQPQT